MSPVLWRKVAPKLSAGRVQSVGMALVVRRELERLAHVPAAFAGVTATLRLAAAAPPRAAASAAAAAAAAATAGGTAKGRGPEKNWQEEGTGEEEEERRPFLARLVSVGGWRVATVDNT